MTIIIALDLVARYELTETYHVTHQTAAAGGNS